MWSPTRPKDIKLERVKRVKMKNKALDTLFNGGLVKSCSYLFSAAPGFGKTTWALQCCQFFENPLFISSEQSKQELGMKIKALGIDLDHAEIEYCSDLELVCRNITDAYDGVIYDSADRFTCADTRAPAGSVHQKTACVALIADIALQLGHVGIVISQVNADGEAAGAMGDQHNVTGVIEGKKTGDGGQRVMRMEKHRHGPDSGQLEKVVACTLTAQGLVDFDLVDGK